MVRSSGTDLMLIRNDFPEFGADLVAALNALDVDELTHGFIAADVLFAVTAHTSQHQFLHKNPS